MAYFNPYMTQTMQTAQPTMQLPGWAQSATAEIRYIPVANKMEMEEAEGFAERGSYAGGSYAGRMSRRGFAGGSNGGASYKRDSMGRFSRGSGYAQHGDVRDELIRLMSKTNDDREIQAIEAAIEQIERQ